MEKLKEALRSPTSQGSKLCIYKKSKVRNGRRKIRESSSATSNLFVEACCLLNDDKQKRNRNQEMAFQETLHEAQGSSSHGLMIPKNAPAVATYLPTPVLFTGVPVLRVQLLTQLLGFSVYCCFLK